jgi:hypothetical protein
MDIAEGREMFSPVAQGGEIEFCGQDSGLIARLSQDIAPG